MLHSSLVDVGCICRATRLRDICSCAGRSRPSGMRHVDGAKLDWAPVWNARTRPAMPREKPQSGSNREGESTEAERRRITARRSDEGPVMGLDGYGQWGSDLSLRSIYVD